MKYLFIIFSLFYVNELAAQTFAQKEKAMKNWFAEMSATRDDAKMDSLNKKILITFNSALQNDSSFDYPFDSLRIGNIKSGDNLLRIYTWNIALKDGSNVFYGFMHYYLEKKNKYIVIPLTDKSAEIKRPETALLKPQKWFGAIYYDVVVVKNKKKKKTTYTLLGWDGNDLRTSKRLIESLVFMSNGKAKFGANIFDFKRKRPKRIIFEYSKQASMMLRYDAEYEMIVFDHLAPSQPLFEGQVEYYGPDLTHDGLEFDKDAWIFHENIDVRNPRERIIRKTRKKNSSLIPKRKKDEK